MLDLTVNFHYSQLEATFGTKFIKIRDKKFSANSWRLLHRLKSLMLLFVNEYNSLGSPGNLSHAGPVIRNQRPKIHRMRVDSYPQGGLFARIHFQFGRAI